MTEVLALPTPRLRFDMEGFSDELDCDSFGEVDVDSELDPLADLKTPLVDDSQVVHDSPVHAVAEATMTADCLPHITPSSDQNEWMKVFVPSLLLEGFPRQIPASELLELNQRLLDAESDAMIGIGGGHDPSLDASTLPVVGKPNVVFQSAAQPTLQPQSQLVSALSTSPPLTLPSITYPYQTFGYSAPAYTLPFSEQPLIPPFTASFPGMEFLNFPETPGLPMSPRLNQETSMAGKAVNGGAGADVGDGTAVPVSVGGEVQDGRGFEGVPLDDEPEGWNIFRMPVGELAEVGLAESLKRKRGRPRGAARAPTATQSRPQAQTASSTPHIMLQPSPIPMDVSRAVIGSQEALEGELKAAVDELHARVRGILERTTPEIVRESGVSVGDPTSVATVRAVRDSLGTLTLPSRAATPLQDFRSSRAATPLHELSLSPAAALPTTHLATLPSTGSSTSSTISPSEAFSPVYKGAWAAPEVARLEELVRRSWITNEGERMVDWRAVVAAYGPTRSKHQILCKAVELGLKGTTTTRGRRKKQKRYQSPPPTTRQS